MFDRPAIDKTVSIWYLHVMETIEQKIIKAYIPYQTTLREVARIIGTDHHRIKRVLIANGIKVVKGKQGDFTEDHKRNLSRACKGRKGWNKGKRMPKESLYKNMASHIRFDITSEWLSRFEDIQKLKFLNSCITSRGGRYSDNTEWYKAYIQKFYIDPQFNKIYDMWLGTNDKYLRPTIDHINPRANGGGNGLDNLQFLSWFENRAKSDMLQSDWQRIKNNIKDYLL